MRPSRLLLFLIALLIPAAPASAAASHTVQPGETLWSIAAANNLTTRTVAAYNGLSEDAQVVLGSTIMVPTTVEGYAALQRTGAVPATPTASAAPAATTAAATSGSYTVQPGDTLVLEVTMEKLGRRMGRGRAVASVDGEVACEALLSFIIPPEGALR